MTPYWFGFSTTFFNAVMAAIMVFWAVRICRHRPSKYLWPILALIPIGVYLACVYAIISSLEFTGTYSPSVLFANLIRIGNTFLLGFVTSGLIYMARSVKI